MVNNVGWAKPVSIADYRKWMERDKRFRAACMKFERAVKDNNPKAIRHWMTYLQKKYPNVWTTFVYCLQHYNKEKLYDRAMRILKQDYLARLQRYEKFRSVITEVERGVEKVAERAVSMATKAAIGVEKATEQRYGKIRSTVARAMIGAEKVAEGAVKVAILLSPLSLTGCAPRQEQELPSLPPLPPQTEPVQPTPAPVSAPAGGYVINDDFNTFDSTIWEKRDGRNKEPFGCGFSPDQISFSNGKLALTLDRKGGSYGSGEYRTLQTYGYGTLTASIKPSGVPGTVGGSLFLYTGEFGKPSHFEIDLEAIGDRWQFNYYIAGKGKHEQLFNSSDLGFVPSQGFHDYGLTWNSGSIIFTAGGKEMCRVPVKFPNRHMQIMLNYWNGDGSVDEWLGHFNYRGATSAQYEYLRYAPEGAATQPEKLPKPAPAAPGPTAPGAATKRTPLTGLIGAAFNKGRGSKAGNDGVIFEGKGVNDGMVLFEGKPNLGGKVFLFTCQGQGSVKIVFIDGSGHNTGDKTVPADGKAVTLDIPEGTTKINVMATGNPVKATLSGFATADKK